MCVCVCVCVIHTDTKTTESDVGRADLCWGGGRGQKSLKFSLLIFEELKNFYNKQI